MPTPQQFKELLDDAGGAEGHALLYLIPLTQLSSDKVMSDFSCIAPLSKLIQVCFGKKFTPSLCMGLLLQFWYLREKSPWQFTLY